MEYRLFGQTFSMVTPSQSTAGSIYTHFIHCALIHRFFFFHKMVVSALFDFGIFVYCDSEVIMGQEIAHGTLSYSAFGFHDIR